jgi:hypothetical protein
MVKKMQTLQVALLAFGGNQFGIVRIRRQRITGLVWFSSKPAAIFEGEVAIQERLVAFNKLMEILSTRKTSKKL